MLGLSELERRRQYVEHLEKILCNGEHHPLTQNMPSRRPSAEELVSRLEDMRTDTDGPCGELTRLDALRYVTTIHAPRSACIHQHLMTRKKLAIKLWNVALILSDAEHRGP